MTHIAPGEVHIRFFSLDVENTEMEHLAQLLSPPELARADRILNLKVRSRYIAGRGTLRRIIGECLDKNGKDVSLAEGEHGKPYLADVVEHKNIRFNLTHKHDRAALAISCGYEMGIDLENIKKTIPFRSMAKRFFSEKENEDLLILSQDHQLAAFYRCWTRKEAYLKGLGTGLTRHSDSFRVSFLPDEPPLLDDFQYPDLGNRWTLHDISVPEGYCAALAIEGEPNRITCFPWM